MWYLFLYRHVRGLQTNKRPLDSLLLHSATVPPPGHSVSVQSRATSPTTKRSDDFCLGFLDGYYCISCLDQALDSNLALVFDVQCGRKEEKEEKEGNVSEAIAATTESVLGGGVSHCWQYIDQ